jgi:cellulose biosynthesis protein BcsQ
MKTVAIYNMKGGVGKTTSAVNLSYVAAASGARTLLWDLDPQGASSFAFRVPPHVDGFGKKSLEDGRALDAAIRETDYHNLHLLPADFAYRKFERLLDSLGKPDRLVRSLLEKIGRDFDIVFLDCPAGFSLLIEGMFAAADVILVPTIPTVLSLRTLAHVFKWADRSGTQSNVAAFFSMVDRRKALHRHATEWSAANPQIFMSAQIPYSSVVEQMTIRRMPLAAFAAREHRHSQTSGQSSRYVFRWKPGSTRKMRGHECWTRSNGSSRGSNQRTAMPTLQLRAANARRCQTCISFIASTRSSRTCSDRVTCSSCASSAEASSS